MKFTNLVQGMSQSSSKLLAELLIEFIDIETHLDIGDTVTRSWEQEDLLARARETATSLRSPPWNLTVEMLDDISTDSNSWRDGISRWLVAQKGNVA